MKAVVCGRNYTSRLGMIRAVGSLGIDVIVIYTNNRREPDALSRYVAKYIQSPESDKSHLLKCLLSLAENESEKMLLFPTDDYCASVIDRNLEKLKDKYLFQNIDMQQGAIVHAMDKQVQKTLAKEKGLLVVPGSVIKVENGRFNLPDNIQYPCFTKPLISSKGRKGFLRRCNNRDELLGLINMAVSIKPDCDILVEEYKTIDKEYALVGYCDGESVVIPGMLQMLMDGFGRHKGVTSVGKVLFPDDFTDFLLKVKDMMLSMRFVGLFDVDAFSSAGELYFNELNLRFGASGYAFTALGINLPEMLVDRLTSKKEKHSCRIEHEATFVNEKGLMESWQDGYMSWKKVRRQISSADIKFVRNANDPLPYLGLIYKIIQHRFRKS